MTPSEIHDPHHDPDAEAAGAAVRAAALTVQAPPALRARVAEERLRAGRTAPARGGLRMRAGALAVGAAALALALLLVVGGLPGGGAGGPSVQDAAALALARPTAPAPAVDRSDATRLTAAVGRVRFPNYGWSWPGWRTAGARQDRVHGRDATTVTYRGPSGDVGYTIVAGRPLDEPGGARHMTSGGLRLAVLRSGGATIVTWRRGGHTCVLAARGASADELVRFATYS
jgi:hypothetical protein